MEIKLPQNLFNLPNIKTAGVVGLGMHLHFLARAVVGSRIQ